MKTAGNAAKAAPQVNETTVGMKSGEYPAYFTGSKTPFVIIFSAM